jgi:hypothetical protein
MTVGGSGGPVCGMDGIAVGTEAVTTFGDTFGGK